MSDPRMIAAIDVLKATHGDVLSMRTIEVRYGKDPDQTDRAFDPAKARVFVLAALALDILTGEQPVVEIASAANNWSPAGTATTYCKFCSRDTDACIANPCQQSGRKKPEDTRAAIGCWACEQEAQGKPQANATHSCAKGNRQ